MKLTDAELETGLKDAVLRAFYDQGRQDERQKIAGWLEEKAKYPNYKNEELDAVQDLVISFGAWLEIEE